MNQSNRAVQFALLALGMCILIAAAVGLQRSKSEQMQRLSATLASKQKELAEARVKVKELPKLEARFDELTQQVAVLEPSLPTEAYIPTFLDQIQSLAAQTNNKVTLIKPEAKRKLDPKAARPAEPAAEGGDAKPAGQAPPPVQKSPYDEIGIQLDLEGTYWSSLNFLEKLREFPKMIAVNEITMKPRTVSRSEVASAEPRLDISMQLTAVMAKER